MSTQTRNESITPVSMLITTMIGMAQLATTAGQAAILALLTTMTPTTRLRLFRGSGGWWTWRGTRQRGRLKSHTTSLKFTNHQMKHCKQIWQRQSGNVQTIHGPGNAREKSQWNQTDWNYVWKCKMDMLTKQANCERVLLMCLCLFFFPKLWKQKH